MRDWFIGALGLCVVLFLLTLPYVTANWPSSAPARVAESKQQPSQPGNPSDANSAGNPVKAPPQSNTAASGEKDQNAQVPASISSETQGRSRKRKKTPPLRRHRA